jgi:hypothetical protein
VTQRLSDIWARLAAERDHQARMCAELALVGEWDRAKVHANKYLVLTQRCDQLVVGKAWEGST